MVSYLVEVSCRRRKRYAALPFIRVVDRSQTDVFLVFKGSCNAKLAAPLRCVSRLTVEFLMLPVKCELRPQEVNVLLDELAIA